MTAPLRHLASLALLAASCASSPMQRSDEPLIDDPSGPAAATAPARPPAPVAAPAPRAEAAPPQPRPPTPASAPGSTGGPRPPPGTILRGELKGMLARSPGSFLARVDAEPTFAGKAFRGWRIRAFFRDDPRLAGVLQPGDLVLKVNDHAVERPEQFLEVWQAAANRADLTVDIVRNFRPARLAWRIVDPK